MAYLEKCSLICKSNAQPLIGCLLFSVISETGTGMFDEHAQFKSTHQTAEQNQEKKDWFDGIRLHVFVILTKSRCVVRSGIRTHAYKSRLRPERSALDRSTS